jgi:hypothetical protein
MAAGGLSPVRATDGATVAPPGPSDIVSKRKGRKVMNKPNIQQQLIHDMNLRAGLLKNHAKTDKFMVSGKEMTAAAFIAMLDGRIAAAQASDAKRREHAEAVATYHAMIGDTASDLSSLRVQLIAQLGKTAPALGDYGIAPRKTPQPLTVEERKKAIEKRRATRKARHTMGPKQRLEVTAPPEVSASLFAKVSAT